MELAQDADTIAQQVHSHLISHAGLLDWSSEVPLMGNALDQIVESKLDAISNLISDCVTLLLSLDSRRFFCYAEATKEATSSALSALCIFAESLPEQSLTSAYIGQLQHLIQYPELATKCMVLLASYAGRRHQDKSGLSQVHHTCTKMWGNFGAQWTNRQLGELALMRLQFFAFGTLCSEKAALGSFAVQLMPLCTIWRAEGEQLLSWLLPSVSHFIKALDQDVMAVALDRWLAVSERADQTKWPPLLASHRLLTAVAHGFYSRLANGGSKLDQIPLLLHCVANERHQLHSSERALLFFLYAAALYAGFGALKERSSVALKLISNCLLDKTERVLLTVPFFPETCTEVKAAYFLTLTLAHVPEFSSSGMRQFPKLNRLIRVYYWSIFSGPDGLFLPSSLFKTLDELLDYDAAARVARARDLENVWTKEFVLPEWAGNKPQKVKVSNRLFFLSQLGRVTHTLGVFIKFNTIDAVSHLAMVTLVYEFAETFVSNWRISRLLNPQLLAPVKPSVIASTLRLTNLLVGFSKVAMFTVIAVYQVLLPAARITRDASFENVGKTAIYSYLQMLATLQRMHFVALSFGEDGFDAWQSVLRDALEPFILLYEEKSVAQYRGGSAAELVAYRLCYDARKSTDKIGRCEALFWVVLVKHLVQYLSPRTMEKFVFPRLEQFLFPPSLIAESGGTTKFNAANEHAELLHESHAVVHSVFEKSFFFSQLCCDYGPNYVEGVLNGYPLLFDVATSSRYITIVLRGLSFYEYANVARYDPSLLNMTGCRQPKLLSTECYERAASLCIRRILSMICAKHSGALGSDQVADSLLFQRDQLLSILFAQLNVVSLLSLPPLLAVLEDLLFAGEVDLASFGQCFTASIKPPIGLQGNPKDSIVWQSLYEAISSPSKGFEYYRKRKLVSWYLAMYHRAQTHDLRHSVLPSKL